MRTIVKKKKKHRGITAHAGCLLACHFLQDLKARGQLALEVLWASPRLQHKQSSDGDSRYTQLYFRRRDPRRTAMDNPGLCEASGSKSNAAVVAAAAPPAGSSLMSWQINCERCVSTPAVLNESLKACRSAMAKSDLRGPGRENGAPVSGRQQQLVSRIGVPDHAPQREAGSLGLDARLICHQLLDQLGLNGATSLSAGRHSRAHSERRKTIHTTLGALSLRFFFPSMAPSLDRFLAGVAAATCGAFPAVNRAISSATSSCPKYS